jgi:hypothetical protein
MFLLCGAIGTYAGLRAAYGNRPVYVHVRWAPATDEVIRRELEERFSLTDGELRDSTTWGYVLTDVSRDNIRALVMDPAVEDTHQLHRSAYRPGYFVPRLPYSTSYPLIPSAMELLALILAALSLLALAAAAVESLAPAAARGPLAALRDVLLHPITAIRSAVTAILRWIESRIPVAEPESAALFRVVFGVALLAIVLQRPVDAAWAVDPANALSPVHRALLAMFIGHDGIVTALPAWIAVCGLLFICGFFTRAAFALTTVGVFAWAILYTTQTTYHTISAMLVTLICLQWAPWGDAWSIDAWRRRNLGVTPAASRAHGYTTWIPGFVLGLIFAAAAFAKLRDSGLAWILNGTVKYHFLSDSRQAMVDWGLQLGQYHAIAVALSFGAIAIESLVIIGALSRRYAYRFVAGAASLALLAGFTLLQGLFWPGWWILLLSFLPWHFVGSSAAAGWRGPQTQTATEVRGLRSTPALVVLVLVVLQLGVSLTRLEVSPFLSTYDMYATTYASPAEYEQKSGDAYWLVATDLGGERRQCRISRREADALAGLAVASNPAAIRNEALARCFEVAVRADVAVESTRARVDWARWRLQEPLRVRIADRVQ